MSTVSAIIVSYNYARYLPQAVESALGQAGGDVEVVVVDDGSTDDTERVMEAFRGSVRYVRQENQGVAAARNRGIAESRSWWVAFLDADDFWKPGKIDRQLAELARRPECRASYTGYEPLGREFGPRAKRADPGDDLLTALVTRGNVITAGGSSVVCDRALFGELGGFDVALSDCADWDMWIRIASVTKLMKVDEPLVVYRQHQQSMTRNVALRERDSVRVLEKAFAMKTLPASLRLRRRGVFARNFMVLAGSYFHSRSYVHFARCLARAIALDARQAAYPLAWPVRAFARMGIGANGGVGG